MRTVATNLHSFVSFGKTHKLHNAIDHWLAGVAGQAHVALDAVTKEKRVVYTGQRGDGDTAVRRGQRVWGHLWGTDRWTRSWKGMLLCTR